MKKKIRKFLLVFSLLSPFLFWFTGIIAQIFSGDSRYIIGGSRFSLDPLRCMVYIFTDVKNFVILLIVSITVGYLLRKFLLIVNEEGGTLDKDRNFQYSAKGTYGTSGWMTDAERQAVLHKENDVAHTSEFILGKSKDNSVYTVPKNSRMNRHIAVYGASGTGKSRAFARTYMIQSAKQGHSMIVTDPKGELFESMSPYLRNNGYTVKVLNLVNLEHSDSWNCLDEIEGDDLKAQIFANAIIENTSDKTDFFTDCEMMLLKALSLYVENSDILPHNMDEVIKLFSTKSPYELDALFDDLEYNDKTAGMIAAYNTFKNSSDNVKGNVIIGLSAKLQVFQSNKVKKITSSNEIDLTKPGKEKCAYFCITSDQHSAFDFLAVLFYSMLFIKLVEFADSQPGNVCPVPVDFVLDEFPNIGAIPDFTKKISTIRSRGLSVALIFQNIAQLQNRYPKGQWEEILGNCDTHLFLGCTDETTAEFISKRTGTVTIAVQSKSRDSKGVSPLAKSKEKESNGEGKRALLNADEVLRLDGNDELILLRGQKPLIAQKFDYSLHPESKKLTNVRVKDYTPQWRRDEIKKEERKKKKKEEIDNSISEKKKEELRSKVYTKQNSKPKGF